MNIFKWTTKEPPMSDYAKFGMEVDALLAEVHQHEADTKKHAEAAVRSHDLRLNAEKRLQEKQNSLVAQLNTIGEFIHSLTKLPPLVLVVNEAQMAEEARLKAEAEEAARIEQARLADEAGRAQETENARLAEEARLAQEVADKAAADEAEAIRLAAMAAAEAEALRVSEESLSNFKPIPVIPIITVDEPTPEPEPEVLVEIDPLTGLPKAPI